MPANILSSSLLSADASLYRVLAEQVQQVIDQAWKINYSNGNESITGSPDDFTIELTKNYSQKLKAGGSKVGKLKFTYDYQVQIQGLNEALEPLLSTIVYQDQSFEQATASNPIKPSSVADVDSSSSNLLWESLNTFFASGEVDVNDLTIKQKLSVSASAKVEGEGVKIDPFTVGPVTVSGLPSTPSSVNVVLTVPTSTYESYTCQNTSYEYYQNPTYQVSSGGVDVGYQLYPEYQSLEISNLKIGGLVSEIQESWSDLASGLNSAWKNSVCGALKAVNWIPGVKVKCPSPPIPNPVVNDAFIDNLIATGLNQALASADLSAEVSPVIEEVWNRSIYDGDEVTGFVQSPASCNDLKSLTSSSASERASRRAASMRSAEESFDGIDPLLLDQHADVVGRADSETGLQAFAWPWLDLAGRTSELVG